MKTWQTSHTQITSASPEAIWQRWVAVEKWPEEDKNLTWAKLEGDFVVGSKIIMKPAKGPKSAVTITEVTPNKSFSTVGNLPLGKLTISHSIHPQTSGVAFTHTIIVSGLLRKLFVKLFIGKLADDLPEKMKNIARLAEAS